MTESTVDQVDDLRNIAEAIRGLPKSMGVEGHISRVLDISVAAGHLIKKAMTHGLYGGAEHLELRTMFEMADNYELVCQRPSGPQHLQSPPAYQYFAGGCNWLWRKEGREHRSLDREFVREACEFHASQIDDLVEDLSRVPAAGKPRRGRPPKSDSAKDMKIAERWAAGGHKTFADLGAQLGITKHEVRRAIDRHRKRLSRKN